jgi:hypothetical protein
MGPTAPLSSSRTEKENMGQTKESLFLFTYLDGLQRAGLSPWRISPPRWEKRKQITEAWTDASILLKATFRTI